MANVELSTLGATIKTAYEGEENTNAFTDADQTQLGNNTTAIAGKEDSLGNPTSSGFVLSSSAAGVRSWVAQSSGDVQSVNGQTGFVDIDADDIADASTTNKFASQSELDQIATNQTNITTNTSDIETNESNISVNAGNISNNSSALLNKEDSLGNPTVSGYVLSSTTAGVRSWVVNSGGGGGGGVIITDWTDFPSSAVGDVCNFNGTSFTGFHGQWRRVGGSLEMNLIFNTSYDGTGTTPFLIYVPSNINFQFSANYQHCGTWAAKKISGSNYYDGGVLSPYISAESGFQFQIDSGSTTGGLQIGQAGSFFRIAVNVPNPNWTATTGETLN